MNILVYGATGGIGQEICRQFSRKENRMFLVGRSQKKLKQLADQIEVPDSNVLCTDTITSERNFQRLTEWVESLGVNLQIGVHCVGQGCQKNTRELELTEVNDILNINLVSAFAFYQIFSKVKDTRVYELIYFSSASIDQGWPKNSLYGASKAGLEYFARSLQKEIRQEGGRVWLYKPGSVNTPFFDKLKNHLPKNKMISAEEMAKIVISNLAADPDIYFPPISLRTD